jgi:hypothetical protein
MPYVATRNGGRIAAIVKPHLGRQIARRMADHGGRRMTELVKMNTPIAPPQDPVERRVRLRKRPRGTLRESIEQKAVMPTRNGFESGCETHDPVAPHVEWSTRPHEIHPIPPNRRLAFVKDGRWHFPTVVHHPGTRGQAMFRIGGAMVEHELRGGLLQPELEDFKRESERVRR